MGACSAVRQKEDLLAIVFDAMVHSSPQWWFRREGGGFAAGILSATMWFKFVGSCAGE